MLLVVLVAFASCESGSDPFATDAVGTEEPDATREPSRGQDDPPTEVKRPKPGEYVYEVIGVGATTVPSGTVITDTLSVSGDIYTIDVTNSRNDNRRQIRLRWEDDRILQLSNDTVVDGERVTCTYEPPLVILHNPVRAEDFPIQRFTSRTCEQSFEVSVVERTSVKDKKGKAWQVWTIEVLRNASGRRDEETHWFSPELGRDIRLETATQTAADYNQTALILSSYPAPA